MRDLQADLEICNKATKGPWVFDKYDVDIWSQPNLWRVANVRLYADMQFIAAAREGWPEAIERTINAEAEVERLRMALDKIANPLKYIQMEARAKGAELNGVYAIMLSKDPSYLQEIALAELDKEGER